jgi:hypothetical protein
MRLKKDTDPVLHRMIFIGRTEVQSWLAARPVDSSNLNPEAANKTVSTKVN